MKYFKKLIGEKVYLSPICLEDAMQYCEWLNDLEVSKHLLIFNRQLNLEREQTILEEMQKNDEQVFGIITREDDKLIGNCSLFRINERHRKGEVGIFIGDKSYWNKGYGTEALGLLCDYGFNILNLNNIMLEVFDFNERAINCYRKIGFKLIGKRRQAIFIGGRVVDELYMDLLAEEFQSPYINKIFGW